MKLLPFFFCICVKSLFCCQRTDQLICCCLFIVPTTNVVPKHGTNGAAQENGEVEYNENGKPKHNFTLAELKEKTKMMMVPQPFMETLETSRRMIMEIIFSDSQGRDVVDKIQAGTYKIPSKEDAEKWSCPMTTTNSAHAMFFLINHECQQIENLHLRRVHDQAFARLFGTYDFFLSRAL